MFEKDWRADKAAPVREEAQRRLLSLRNKSRGTLLDRSRSYVQRQKREGKRVFQQHRSLDSPVSCSYHTPPESPPNIKMRVTIEHPKLKTGDDGVEATEEAPPPLADVLNDSDILRENFGSSFLTEEGEDIEINADKLLLLPSEKRTSRRVGFDQNIHVRYFHRTEQERHDMINRSNRRSARSRRRLCDWDDWGVVECKRLDDINAMVHSFFGPKTTTTSVKEPNRTVGSLMEQGDCHVVTPDSQNDSTICHVNGPSSPQSPSTSSSWVQQLMLDRLCASGR